jgi:hypothetical protein
MAAQPLDATQESQSRRLTCGGKVYVVRRFADGISALYDEHGRLLAGWPLTAFWPREPLASKTDDEWCALVRAIYAQR